MKFSLRRFLCLLLLPLCGIILITGMCVGSSSGISAKRVRMNVGSVKNKNEKRGGSSDKVRKLDSTPDKEDCRDLQELIDEGWLSGSEWGEWIEFSGFEKRASSDKESFLVTNSSDSVVGGLKIELIYRDLQDRMLHRRCRMILTLLPPGETRLIEIPALDRQHSMYYYRSLPPRRGGMPFKVNISLVAIKLE